MGERNEEGGSSEPPPRPRVAVAPEERRGPRAERRRRAMKADRPARRGGAALVGGGVGDTAGRRWGPGRTSGGSGWRIRGSTGAGLRQVCGPEELETRSVSGPTPAHEARNAREPRGAKSGPGPPYASSRPPPAPTLPPTPAGRPDAHRPSGSDPRGGRRRPA